MKKTVAALMERLGKLQSTNVAVTKDHIAGVAVTTLNHIAGGPAWKGDAYKDKAMDERALEGSICTRPYNLEPRGWASPGEHRRGPQEKMFGKWGFSAEA